MSTRMQSSGVYVYGLVRSDVVVDLGQIGVEEDGVSGAVYTLPAGSIAAVVSARKDRSSVMPVRRDLDAHQRVTARVMEVGTILPFAFGQVARSERAVLRLLREHEQSVLEELDRLDGRVQMGLKVHWDVENIYQYIIDADPDLAALRDSIFASEEPGMAERIELGERFDDALQARRAELVESIIRALPVSTVPPKELPLRGEKAVADLMFLIERGDRSRFEEEVRQLAGRWPPEFTFRVTGPWAPFNFVEVQLPAAGDGGAAS